MTFYSLNKDYYLIEPLKKFLIESKAELAFKDFQKKIAKIPAKFVVYGSFAKGEPKRKSDLDVLVISDNVEAIKEEVDKVNSELLKQYGLPVMVTYVAKNELKKRRKELIFRAILEEGITLGEEV